MQLTLDDGEEVLQGGIDVLVLQNQIWVVVLESKKAANKGYVQGFEQELIRLRQSNPSYTPFFSRILELANDFDYEETTNLIDRNLSEESE